MSNLDETSVDHFVQRAIHVSSSPSIFNYNVPTLPISVPKFSIIDQIVVLKALSLFLSKGTSFEWNIFFKWWGEVYCKFYVRSFSYPINNEHFLYLNEENISKSDLKSMIINIANLKNGFPTLAEINSALILLRDQRLSTLQKIIVKMSSNEIEYLYNLITFLRTHIQVLKETIENFCLKAQPSGSVELESYSSKDVYPSIMEGKDLNSLISYIDVEGEDKSNNLLLGSNERSELEGKEDSKMSYEDDSITVHLSAPDESISLASAGSNLEEMPDSDHQYDRKDWKKKMLLIIREISYYKKGYIFSKMVLDSDALGYSEIVKKPICLNSIKNGIRDEVMYF